MKADVQNIRETGKNTDSYRKENSFAREISILDPANGSAIMLARFYWPGNTAYCCIWINGTKVYGRGYGKAGGYGYHKESAALGEAIRDAGIELSECISGRGESAMYDACEAVAKAVTGKRKVFRHVAHG